MKRSFSIERLSELSGKKAVFYAMKFFDQEKNELDRFIETFEDDFETEIGEIISRIEEIAFHFGAREELFTIGEGTIVDGVCALCDKSNKNLRLYCIRYGNLAVILGNGGHKPKSIRRFQEDERLTRENKIVREVAKLIAKRMEEKEIFWRGNELSGNLTFDFEKDED